MKVPYTTMVQENDQFVDDSISLSALAELWDEPVVYVKQYSEAFRSINIGYFLSFMTSICTPGQWVVLNSEILEDNICFTKKLWRNTRKLLIEADILRYKRINLNENAYTLNEELIQSSLQQYSELNVGAILTPPLAINKLHLKTIVFFGLQYKAAIFLAFINSIIPHKELHDRCDFSDWIENSIQETNLYTSLSRHEQTSCIEQLVGIGILESQAGGFPAKRQVRINFQQLSVLTEKYLLLR